MNKKVRLSAYSIVITCICIIVMASVSAYGFSGAMARWIPVVISVALIAMIIAALLFMPLSVSIDDRNLTLNSPLRKLRLPLRDIADIQLCQPTMAESRICGSGGWFGHWGLYSEPSIGRYFASYGRASECFLVVMKSGKKYLLSCQNPQEVVQCVESLKKSTGSMPR